MMPLSQLWTKWSSFWPTLATRTCSQVSGHVLVAVCCFEGLLLANISKMEAALRSG